MFQHVWPIEKPVNTPFATASQTIDQLVYIAEDVSLGFDRWENRYTRGPSL